MVYEGQVIGGGGAKLRGKVGIEGVEVFHVDEEGLRVVDKAFSVGEHVFVGLEATDELLQLLEDGVAAGGGLRVVGAASAVAP